MTTINGLKMALSIISQKKKLRYSYGRLTTDDIIEIIENEIENEIIRIEDELERDLEFYEGGSS
jgi:predicted DNA-binding transcriptional regulator